MPRWPPPSVLLPLAAAVLGQLPVRRASEEDITGAAVDISYLRPEVWSNDTYASECELPAGSGRMSGVCVDDIEGLRDQLTFCKDSVRYRACVPAHQPLWSSWNASKKDQMLGDIFKSMLERRLAVEANFTEERYIELRFTGNPSCISNLRHILCWYNFPKCSDQNVSLPLCRTSCEQYYTNCRYEANRTDNLHDPCKDSFIEQDGLFGSTVHGPDQMLAEDTEQCESTRSQAEELEDAANEEIWFVTPFGLAVVVLAGIAVLLLAAYFLVPYGLRAYILWAVRRIMDGPQYIWHSLPVLKGRTLLALLVVIFVGLTGFGMYRRFQNSGGFNRFQPPEETAAAAQEASDGFTPPMANNEFLAETELTRAQLRQLISSCSCTGSGSPDR